MLLTRRRAQILSPVSFVLVLALSYCIVRSLPKREEQTPPLQSAQSRLATQPDRIVRSDPYIIHLPYGARLNENWKPIETIEMGSVTLWTLEANVLLGRDRSVRQVNGRLVLGESLTQSSEPRVIETGYTAKGLLGEVRDVKIPGSSGRGADGIVYDPRLSSGKTQPVILVAAWGDRSCWKLVKSIINHVEVAPVRAAIPHKPVKTNR